jgi:Right handed beta helix region
MRPFLAIFGLAIALLGNSPAQAQSAAAKPPITVATAADLINAIRSAKGGETISLAPGNYGDLAIDGRRMKVDFPQEVTITAQDKTKPPVFTAIYVRSASNITFANVLIDYVYRPGDIFWQQRNVFIFTKNMKVTDSVFDGDLVSNTGTAADGGAGLYGLFVRESDGLVIERCSFKTWYRALMVSETKNIAIVQNTISEMRSDGMNFASVSKVLIDGNTISSFKKPPSVPDHPDMIQFWSVGARTATSDVKITNNILDMGAGGWTQSIFMRNEVVDMKKAGPEMFYKNIEISGNTIHNSHLHGISVGETNGLIIANNRLNPGPAQDKSALWIPRINVASGATNVRITDNWTASDNETRLRQISAAWVVKGNRIINAVQGNVVAPASDVAPAANAPSGGGTLQTDKGISVRTLVDTPVSGSITVPAN